MYHRIADKLGNEMKTWLQDEAGNTTVDWVVLLSGILGMVLIVMLSISGGVQVFGEKAEAELTARDVGFE